ncbi:MAG: VOC family protein [Myxococcales bacterium]|nr:VOC family protein [Myxococcales bacterium]
MVGLLACSGAPRSTAPPAPTPATSAHRPPGYPELSAALNVPDLETALPFYERAMGAQVLQRLHGLDGTLRSAQVRIGGDSVLLLTAEDPDHRGPAAVGGTPLRLYMYVEDVDAAFAGALAAGAKVQQPLQNLFWGDRGGQIKDPAGYVWYLATHVEDISNQEFARRSQQAIDTFARGEVPQWTLQHTASRWRPDGYATITPIAIVRDIDEASEFAQTSFGATVVRHVADAAGSSIHAELRIGDSFLRLSKEYEQYQHDSPLTLGGTPAGLHLYVRDAGQTCERAAAARATLVHPVLDAGLGERTCRVVDPSGFPWSVATFVEELSNETVQQRFLVFLRQNGPREER